MSMTQEERQIIRSIAFTLGIEALKFIIQKVNEGDLTLDMIDKLHVPSPDEMMDR